MIIMKPKSFFFLKLEESCTIWVGAQAFVNWPKQTWPFKNIMKYESCIYVWVYKVWIINKIRHIHLIVKPMKYRNIENFVCRNVKKPQNTNMSIPTALSSTFWTLSAAWVMCLRPVVHSSGNLPLSIPSHSSNFFGCQNWQGGRDFLPLASNELRPGIFLNVLQCVEQTTKWKIYTAPNVKS